MTEESRIFKSFLRGLLRHLMALSAAIKKKDYAKAELLTEGLIKDIEADLKE